jgi:RNA polymerase sigma factor (sigma-70 family)
MTLEELENTLEGCRTGSRWSQKRLYTQFFSYALSISLGYTMNQEDAKDICQDSFVKAFTKIGDCESAGSFKGWLRRIVVNTAIDHFRKQRAQPVFDDLETASYIADPAELSGIATISMDEKNAMVNLLPPAYRLAFNLYAIEGFTTLEIAQSLQIAEGTVRSNLAKARFRLKKMIEESEKIKIALI